MEPSREAALPRRPRRTRVRRSGGGRGADFGPRHERVPAGAPERGRVAAPVHAPGPDRERARRDRSQGGQSQQRQERRARDRPLAVDGGRLDPQRDRSGEGIRRPEAGGRPDRDRRLRAPCRGADRLLAGGERLRPDPRRDQGRLGVRDRALRRRRLGRRAARQERDRGPRDHPAHRRARRLELGDARRGRCRRPRRARGHLPDRDRFARLRPCSPPAARAANERDVPPRQLERGAALRVHLDRRRARPYLAARLRDRRAPGRPRRPGDDDLGRQRPDVARDPGELRDRLAVGSRRRSCRRPCTPPAGRSRSRC